MNRSLFFVIACLSFTNAFSQNSVVLDEVTSGLSKPIGIVNDGKSNFLYVVEQGGTIKKFDPIQKSSPELFANLTSKVNSNGGEKGLLGLAFHPKYDENGFFFVNYTTASQSIIARFKALNGVFDLASEKIILSVAQPFSNHNAGDLAFGPDGFLYVPMGDGGSGGDPGNRAQNGQELLGKILRLDINTENAPYLIPADNPFVSFSTVKPEIWALGLRNPWRISFTKGGDLYIADVGQDKMEEINFHAANDNSGLNYGWRCKEGTDNYNTNGCGDLSRFTNPIHTYLHSSSNGCSVTGGHVYEGSMESL
ncbi:MAG TPA: PQQ-dependent sugar dehydrogenase, partial [Saprospiraceae bacterium]|nr:PQQ-dependent sugar dehydrogenase [Saprospiraceae bacterium]